MFYSLQEVAEKFNKTEEEIKELVKDGRLREFRDGPNLLFKVDEVEALMSDTGIVASKDTPTGTEQQVADEDEIFLASETPEAPAAEDELADADTVVSGKGINVLGETDSDYQLADAMGETKAASGETPLAPSGETSLEEIEGDVNLDSFGSGSGLLDLSLQADDTSLGGILDEIYTPEGEEGKEAAEVGSAMEVAAEAEQMLPEEEFPTPQPSAPAIAQAYVEPVPDKLSNAFGIMLFLPLLAVVYTAIVAVAGFNDTMPATLEKIQGTIWYIVGGAAGIAGLIIIAAFMLGGTGSKTTKKPKAKKEKKPKKAKKEKKPKKAEETPEPVLESEIEAQTETEAETETE